MSNKELMLAPAILLEAMHSKERVRKHLEALIRAQAEATPDTAEPVEQTHVTLAIAGQDAPVDDEGLLVFN